MNSDLDRQLFTYDLYKNKEKQQTEGTQLKMMVRPNNLTPRVTNKRGNSLNLQPYVQKRIYDLQN